MTASRLCAFDDMPAARGQDLCAGHREELEQNLNDTELLLHLIWDMTLPTKGDGNRRGRPIDSAAPASLTAIAATDWRTHPDKGDQLVSVVAILQRWAVTVWDRHPLVRPAHPTIGWAQDLIREHLDWLLRTPRVQAFAADMHDTAHMLRSCAGEILPPIGRHLAPHPRRPETDCGGRLYPTLTSTIDNPGVVCIDCGESYQGAWEVRRLGLVLQTP